MVGGLAVAREAGSDLFGEIGAFLCQNGLSPEPAHYHFAFSVLSNPAGPLASAVTSITDGGVRLSRQDIADLGGTALPGAPVALVPPAAPAAVPDGLIDRTRSQMDGFAGLVRAMQDETRDFGRDLASHAAAMDGGALDLAGLVRVTAAMLSRVIRAEQRLAAATEETEELRARLNAAEASARQDPLTGLANRRAFEEAFAAATGTGDDLCLALCDVDRFKRINDGFGHVVGDRVLAAIGQSLSAACADHLVVRHGGEEFGVLVRGLDLDRATALMEEAREQVAARRFRSRESGELIGTVTVSVGLTAVMPGEPLEPAYARADRYLYTAKRTGRDRLCAG